MYISQLYPPPRGEVYQKGNSCMVTHPEITQNGTKIAATENKSFQQHQPSSKPSLGAIPCNNPNQSEKIYRKNALVENLVNTTVTIIKVIWFDFPVHVNSQVIPLRLFIQETLRRSRTSWSTLQTALYYLIKIKQQIKFLGLNPDLWTLNSKDNNNNSNNDPATCGRRMFLASLIVASKYLQDRNYANNAWSKICGLSVQEINNIERRFLKLIDYNLFIGENDYKRWTGYLNSYIQSTAAHSESEVTDENQHLAIAQLEKVTFHQPQVTECKVHG